MGLPELISTTHSKYPNSNSGPNVPKFNPPTIGTQSKNNLGAAPEVPNLASSGTTWDSLIDYNPDQKAKQQTAPSKAKNTRASEIAKNREKRERARKRKVGQAAIAGVMVLVVAASGVIGSRANKKDKGASVEHPTEAGDIFEGQTSEDVLSTLAETEKETSENSVEAREFSK